MSFAAAFRLTASGFSTLPNWNGSEHIPLHSARRIFTWNGAIGATFPTLAQTTALTADVAAYIRGDDSKEVSNGGAFRDRLTPLGDIINSSPVFVGGSAPTVYIGANDGMLHAFDASTGVSRRPPGDTTTTNPCSINHGDSSIRREQSIRVRGMGFANNVFNSIVSIPQSAQHHPSVRDCAGQ